MTITLPSSTYFLLSLPEPHILLITINRPKQLNSLSFEANLELDRLFTWAEQEEAVWCIILTGAGNKAFCAGMDLVNAHDTRTVVLGEEGKIGFDLPPNGFGGISNRRSYMKPVIAAVNGYTLGGGMEMTLSCDIVVATRKSKFGLPEVKQGVVIKAGGLARLARSVSYQVASELVLTGRFMEAEEAKAHGLVNSVINNDENVVEAALVYARKIVANSPDSVFLTKKGLLLALERPSMTDATEEWVLSKDAIAWGKGDNCTEGLKAFAEKRKPQWTNPVVGKSKL